MIELNLKKFSRAIEDTESIKMSGKVTQVIGLVIESKGPNVSIGELCHIRSRFPGVEPIPAEVVGFREGLVLLMPIGEMQGIGPGCEVVSAQKTLRVKVGTELLGRVLDGLGNPMDGKGPMYAQSRRIACDAWNKIKDTEYTMNALTWGWWIDRVYQYNDADHVVLRDATEGENRARITSSVITGLFITGDDFSADTMAISRARRFLTNPDINRLATGRSFRPLTADNDRSEQTFIRCEPDGSFTVAAFNYGEEPRPFTFDRPLMGLDASARYMVEELWEHAPVSIDAQTLIPAKDVRVFRLTKQD